MQTPGGHGLVTSYHLLSVAVSTLRHSGSCCWPCLEGGCTANVPTDPILTTPPNPLLDSTHNKGHFGKIDYLVDVQNVAIKCCQQRMDAVSDTEQGEKSCDVIYRSHNMASSLPESRNRSGVSSWPTGGWSLTD